MPGNQIFHQNGENSGSYRVFVGGRFEKQNTWYDNIRMDLKYVDSSLVKLLRILLPQWEKHDILNEKQHLNTKNYLERYILFNLFFII